MHYIEHLNTSYVDIKPGKFISKQSQDKHLNTSYVDIKQGTSWNISKGIIYLNTSYVDIKHERYSKLKSAYEKFKYILCWY